jgi:DNA-binding phage protein
LKKKKIIPSVWDLIDHIETDEDMVRYLEAALKENDPILLAAVLIDIKRAKRKLQGKVSDENEIANEEFGATYEEDYKGSINRIFDLLLKLEEEFLDLILNSRLRRIANGEFDSYEHVMNNLENYNIDFESINGVENENRAVNNSLQNSLQKKSKKQRET